MFSFTLTNLTEHAVLNPTEGSKLLINGKEFRDWDWMLHNGPTSRSDRELRPGEKLEFDYDLAGQFRVSGEYQVIWKGVGFQTEPVELTIDASGTAGVKLQSDLGNSKPTPAR